MCSCGPNDCRDGEFNGFALTLAAALAVALATEIAASRSTTADLLAQEPSSAPQCALAVKARNAEAWSVATTYKGTTTSRREGKPLPVRHPTQVAWKRAWAADSPAALPLPHALASPLVSVMMWTEANALAVACRQSRETALSSAHTQFWKGCCADEQCAAALWEHVPAKSMSKSCFGKASMSPSIVLSPS